MIKRTFTRWEVLDMLQRIREKVWGVDIPSPTVPEYVEHHRDCQEIMHLIDDIIKELYKED